MKSLVAKEAALSDSASPSFSSSPASPACHAAHQILTGCLFLRLMAASTSDTGAVYMLGIHFYFVDG